jgi:arylsulfatase A-like enzyme
MPKERPNIVFIFADDLGYGDVSCLNADGRIPTAHIDRVAAGGMSFTDAHSTSAVCTPSRYGVLTGRYNWRSGLQAGIVGVFGGPLIGEETPTVPGMLQQNGYHTACIGKWHLGWDWPLADAGRFVPDRDEPAPPVSEEVRAEWQEAFSQPIAGGPTTRGFDHYFGVDVPNWPPYVWIEDDRTLGIPSEYLPAERVRQGGGGPSEFGRYGGEMDLASLPGPAMPEWSFEPILPTLGDRACGYIQGQSRTPDPFFLYLPLTSPHTPLAVNDEWKGKSGLNLYADFVMETDAVVGRVLDALEEAGISDETLVMFASDNGCAPYIGVRDLEDQGHDPSGPYRGYKADAWDGGHRIPFLVRWPERIAAGSTCDQTVCLSDLMATSADILGASLADNAGPDSVSLLPLFAGSDEAGREEVVHHSISGRFAIRRGKWKLVLCPGSGGWCPPTDQEAARQGMPPHQLYDMEADPGETTNLQDRRPQVVKDLTDHLQALVDRGRSTPGPELENEVPVDIFKRD